MCGYGKFEGTGGEVIAARYKTGYRYKILRLVFTFQSVAYRGGSLGGFQPPPPPKFRSFDKVEPDCKLSGKCLVFLFKHPN